MFLDLVNQSIRGEGCVLGSLEALVGVHREEIRC